MFLPGVAVWRVILDRVRGFVRLVWLLAPENGLDVLRLAECDLLDRLTLIELYQLLATERVEVESRISEFHRLEE